MSNIKKVRFKVPEFEVRYEPEDIAEALRECRIQHHRKISLIRQRFGPSIEPILSTIHRDIVWRAQHLETEFDYRSSVPPLTKSEQCEMRKVNKYPTLYKVPNWYLHRQRLIQLEENAWHIFKLCPECHPERDEENLTSSEDE